MTQSIAVSANPGQTVSLVTQVLDGYGDRSDGYVPVVASVLLPSQQPSAGFPQPMTRLSTGLYALPLQIPASSSSIGTFIASVFYAQPGSNNPVWQVFQITVSLPFGNAVFTPL